MPYKIEKDLKEDFTPAGKADRKFANSMFCLEEAFNRQIDEAGFFEAVIKAADNAGCEFLFEIPAILFGEVHARAAAIRCGDMKSIGEVFILHREGDDLVQVISGEDVPEKVTQFVRSYAAVLISLQADIQSRRIH